MGPEARVYDSIEYAPRHFACVIPFGNDAHQLAVGCDQKRSHVPCWPL
jgi:hypothetical protein